MGMYHYVRKVWQKPKENELWKEHLQSFREQGSTTRLEHPTRIDRARSLGYRAKQGFVMVRQRVVRGGHTRPQIKGGRRSRNFGTRLSLRKNYQLIAEERAQKYFANLVVLNSYLVGEDGKHAWYEIIMVDPSHPVIKADPHINWVIASKHKGRVFHGKTSAGKRVRGMLSRGTGSEKARPSRRANLRRI